MKKFLWLFLLLGLVASANATTLTMLKGYIATRWYAPLSAATNSGLAPGANKIMCGPAYIGANVTISTIGMKIATTSAGGNVQGAYYNDANGRPGTLIQSSGSMSTASAVNVSASFGGSVQIGPTGANGGPYIWMCSNTDNGTAAFLSAQTGSSPYAPYSIIGNTTVNSTFTTAGLTEGVSCSGANCQGGSSNFGTWPADLSTSTWTTVSSAFTIPFVFFQADSSP